ncbi:MAG: TIGR03000 domain-containing protein [Gemmataceae bacterium]
MVWRIFLFLGSATLVTTLFLTAADAHGPGGGGGAAHGGYHGGGAYGGYHGGGAYGGYHGGGYHYGGYYYPHYGNAFYGPYRPGLYAPYGFYRPYYPYGFFGPGLAFGSIGFGLGVYGLGGYGLGGYGLYRPYYGGTTIVNPTTVVVAPSGAAAAGGTVPPLPQTQEPPQAPPVPDNAAHLQLIVPENAEVLFDGSVTTQTGTSREFVSPPLPTGKVFDYTITARYTGADGKPVTDQRVIHVHANDWFRIDFTRPAPPDPMPVP